MALISSAPTTRAGLPASPVTAAENGSLLSRAVREGRSAKEIALSALQAAGFDDVHKDQRQPGGVDVSFTARDSQGRLWSFDVSGSFTKHRSGLKKSEALWKALGKAAVLREATGAPLVLLTTGLPPRGSTGTEALRQLTGPDKPVFAVIEVLAPSAVQDLRRLREGMHRG